MSRRGRECGTGSGLGGRWSLLLAVVLLAVFSAQVAASPADWAGTDEPPEKQCSDGIDNDGDGKKDHPADPGCENPQDNNEKDEAPACADGVDNDGDRAIDGADRGCSSSTDNDETNPPPPPCSDGADNDGDGKVDFGADPGCASGTDDSELDDQSSTLGAVVTSGEPRVLAPFPIVRLQGRLTRWGTTITRLQVRTAKGSSVLVRCRGRTCPVSRVRRVATTGYRRFRRFELWLETRTTLRLYVTKPGFIGKFTKFRIRAGKAPARRDACLMPGSTSPTSCATR